MIIRRLYKGQQLIRNSLAFSRTKRVPRESKPAQHSRWPKTQQHFNEFNFMNNIEDIKLGLTISESTLFARVSQMSRNGDEECLYLLRERQQDIIGKISEGEDCYDQLRELLSWKIRAAFQFRKWDDMIVGIDNCIQTLKYQKDGLDLAEELCLQHYNQLCAIYIMSDHDKLYNLIESSVDQLKAQGRAARLRSKDLPFGMAQYHSLEERISIMDISNPKYQQYCEMILLKATGMLVLGLRQKAIKLIVILLACPVPQTIREKTYILMLTALTFPNKYAHPISEPLWQRIIHLREIHLIDITELASSSITTEMCEQAIRKLIKNLYSVQLEQMPAELFSIYSKPIFLISENYYLELKYQKFERLFKLLQAKQHQKIRLHLRYLKLAQSIDQQSLQQAEEILRTHIREEETQSAAQEGVYFYRASQVDSDLLRINILKMAETVSLLRKDPSRAEQYSNEEMMLKCTLGVYTTKQPEKQELWEDDWRHSAQGRVPYYYCNLDIERFFAMESVIDI